MGAAVGAVVSRARALGARIAGDAYYTPDALAARLVGLLDIAPGSTVWEPHAGGGAFVRPLLARGAVVRVSDADPEAPALREFSGSVGSFLDWTRPVAPVAPAPRVGAGGAAIVHGRGHGRGGVRLVRVPPRVGGRARGGHPWMEMARRHAP